MGEIVKYSEAGLDLAVVPTWEQVQGVADTLDTMGRNVSWWWGDFLNYCENLFPERWAQLIPDIGWSPKTLQNWMWVANRVPKHIRVSTLPFSVHAEVAKFEPEDQEMWLQLAMEGNWTVSELREAIKPKAEKPPKLVSCPSCGCTFNPKVKGEGIVRND